MVEMKATAIEISGEYRGRCYKKPHLWFTNKIPLEEILGMQVNVLADVIDFLREIGTETPSDIEVLETILDLLLEMRGGKQ